MKQLAFFKNQKNGFGGALMKTRAGRKGARPLATRETMHLVLRSSVAKGDLSFLRPRNSQAISEILPRFARKHGIKIISWANVGNHIHCHIKLGCRFTYVKFIRAVTSAIAMHVAGVSRWKKNFLDGKFWDYRPFTRIIHGHREYLNLSSYIQVNQLEGAGVPRSVGEDIIARSKLWRLDQRSFGRGIL